MCENQRPVVEIAGTFLPEEEGGRRRMPELGEGGYMPHFVVQPPHVRTAIARESGLVEDYLSVAFLPRDGMIVAGRPERFTVELFYDHQVDYASLQPGATFTIREGPKVVGYGTVIRRD